MGEALSHWDRCGGSHASQPLQPSWLLSWASEMYIMTYDMRLSTTVGAGNISVSQFSPFFLIIRLSIESCAR